MTMSGWRQTPATDALSASPIDTAHGVQSSPVRDGTPEVAAAGPASAAHPRAARKARRPPPTTIALDVGLVLETTSSHKVTVGARDEHRQRELPRRAEDARDGFDGSAFAPAARSTLDDDFGLPA